MEHLVEQFACDHTSFEHTRGLAQKLQDQKLWSAAATFWVMAAENSPDPTTQAECLAHAATCYLDQQQYDALAENLLIKALDIDAHCNHSRGVLATLYAKQERWADILITTQVDADATTSYGAQILAARAQALSHHNQHEAAQKLAVQVLASPYTQPQVKNMFVKTHQSQSKTLHTLAQRALARGGLIRPLLINSSSTGGTGLMNPSILPNSKGTFSLIIRHTNYTLYHSEKKQYLHAWGPLTYLHPEDDMHLRTINYYAELDRNLDFGRVDKIDTSQFDTYEPMWTFVGLEDARLVEWEGQLYTTGVRRDTTTNGQGRMELCGINVGHNSVVETSRWRIPPPNDPNSYCEKNWMPIAHWPWHYVKWTNPTEVVRVDPTTQTSHTVHLGNALQLPRDVRGGSQVIKWGDNHHIALTHEVDLFKSEVGRKDGLYLHRFVVWDQDWNVVAYSDDFSIMGGYVEFAVGMCWYDEDHLLITFGFQDNAAYVLKVSKTVIEEMLE